MDVLLVEDDAALAESLVWALRQHGLEVVWRASAEEALALGDLPDGLVLITDFHLPGIDGIALSSAILERTDARIPILLISGRMDDRLRAAAARGLGADCMEKPVAVEKMAEWIEAARRAH